MAEAKERLWFWDNAKALLIILVVVGHALDTVLDTPASYGINFSIYAFHMPLFIFIFGYFSKRALGGERFPWKRLRGYVLLYLAMRAAKLIILAATGNMTLPQLYLFSASDDTWYLMACALWCVLGYGLLHMRPVKPWILLSLSIGLAMLAGYDARVSDTLALSRVLVFLPYFLAGLLIPPDWVEKLRRPGFRWAALAVVICLAGLMLWQQAWFHPLRPLFTGRNPYQNVKAMPYAWGALYRLGSYALSGVLSAAVLLLCSNRRLPLVSRLGARTMQVYFWQMVVIAVLRGTGLLARLHGSVPLWFYITLFAAITFVLGLKPLGVPVGWLVNLRFRKETSHETSA